jgi:hypothetical protein
MAATNRLLRAMLVVGLAHALFVMGAAAQSRASVGDLVEVTTGLGTTLAEIVTGPDPSGYVVIRVPTGKEMPVNTQKLRLVQRAGTPNVAMPVGQAVSWVDGNVREQGSVVKVNGAWCQVRTATATTIGWVECSDLRTGAASSSAAPPATTQGKAPLPKLAGTWENADGSVKVEFQSAGKCFFSFSAMTGPCTYKGAASTVTIMLEGEPLQFAANEDGSLSSVGDGTMPIRLKRK